MEEKNEINNEKIKINQSNSKNIEGSNIIKEHSNINIPSSSSLNELSDNSTKEENETEKEKQKGLKFPTAYSIIIILELIVFILTYIIPKGRYAKLEYDDDSFKVTYPNNTIITLNSSQSTLEELGIKIKLESFKNGNIKKPVAVPNTYERIKVSQTNFLKLFVYPINGLIETADISFFLFILGGCINILTEMNAFSAGMTALSRVLQGKEFLLLSLVFILISICGSTFGMLEEILPFYPILMPIFLKHEIDGILGVASLYMGSMIGNMFSTVNPFAVVIASYSAGINFKDGIIFRVINFAIADLITILYFYRYYRKVKNNKSYSIVYEIKKEIEEKFLSDIELTNNNKDDKNDKDDIDNKNDKYNKNKNEEFTLLQKISLIIFLIGFIIMILGISMFDWFFENMTSTFFVCAIILMFLLRKGEEKSIEIFLKGAGDFVGVTMIVGFARGINITLDKGDVNDTILNSLSKVVNGLPKIIFTIIIFIIFIALGFFIPSSSGLAVLSMPVFAPLADKVNIGRNVVVNAYMFGQNFIQIISLSGLLLIVLQLIGIRYNHWIKFIWPYLIILFVYLIVILIINTFIG